MSSTMTAHSCICLDKAPLFVDGDQGKVYHEECDGYIADIDEFTGFTDKFWNDQLQSRENALVINGSQYRLGVEYPAKGYGMNGEHYKIKMLENGAIIDTADLWHQGTVPEEYRNVLQDNAKFVRLIEVAEYLACPNCGTIQNRTECYKTTCRNVQLTSASKVDLS